MEGVGVDRAARRRFAPRFDVRERSRGRVEGRLAGELAEELVIDGRWVCSIAQAHVVSSLVYVAAARQTRHRLLPLAGLAFSSDVPRQE
jgi:hypothetical protein